MSPNGWPDPADIRLEPVDWRRARACISEGFCPTCSGRLAPAPERVPADGAGGRCIKCGRVAWALQEALRAWAAVDGAS